MSQLTEDDAVIAFAKAWNRLDPNEFLDLLSPDARYASQWVFDEIVGVDSIRNYLCAKMQTVYEHGVANPSSRVRVEAGRTRTGTEGRPCAFMTQGKGIEVSATVVFEVHGGKVSRYDLCIPELFGIVRTGIFPI